MDPGFDEVANFLCQSELLVISGTINYGIDPDPVWAFKVEG